MSAMEAGGSGEKSKSKGKESVDYDSSRFNGKVEEKLYNRVWVRNGAVESILTLCQEFLANIKYKQVTEKGKERLTSWVQGKKLKITPDTFVEIFGLPREENPEFELPNFGIPDLATIFHELLLEGE
ncbi:ATP-dependent protease ATPase subunit HslU like [Actinidia chinensis var. chinensis]|uniref:ATP-dependent protease ATPase subunit HslU like n=1 Tax=Actinidia chinensis var. chinensis TaxID=1590841 RepID=A0A2R6QHJ9_ACTCC|nr:ATP-dependent protease ATPase subunit HslU like [Actinidia chinensis var. chinensis]